MTDLRQAAQQALEALGSDNPDIQLRAAVTLRAALSAPQPEPLTLDQVSMIWFRVYPAQPLSQNVLNLVREVEAAHGIGNDK